MNFVFDFGAVLFTWKPVDLMAQTFPQRAGTPQAAAALAQAMFAHADWNGFDQGVLDMDVLITRTAKRLDLDGDVLHELVAHIGERLQPIPETVALLERLHTLRAQHPAQYPALRLYYLSNMPRPYARALERRHAFLQWFDGGIFSSDVLHIKPDPTIYQLLQSRHALQPADTLFIDDLQANVLAAQGQGWHAVQFESADQLQTHVSARFGYL
jgi:putative hydrolase of the HAD superfamily